jgi:hypothetical protein
MFERTVEKRAENDTPQSLKCPGVNSIFIEVYLKPDFKPENRPDR